MKLVKISVMSAKCTKSDDEGPNNNADVDRFNIGYTASDNSMAPTSSTLYDFNTSGDVGVSEGDMWNFEEPGSSKLRDGVVVFQDWASASLNLTSGAREYDAGSGDEYSSGNKLLSSADMDGIHSISVDGDDVAFDVSVKVTVTDF